MIGIDEAQDSRRSVLFVADATDAIGGGHVMRCLTLADALAQRGMRPRFVVNGKALACVPALSRAPYPVETVSDLAEAAAAAAAAPCAAVVLDSYALARERDRQFRAAGRVLVVLDDGADRPRDCDLLLDPTLGRDAAAYEGLVPPGAAVLCGTAYTLLRPAFATQRAWSLSRRELSGVARILVSLGLTDVGGHTAGVVAAAAPAAPGAIVDVVIGPAAPSRAALEGLAREDARIRLHVDPPDIAALMAEADLAIGAAGTTAWERCCLGLPTIVVVLAPNQEANARALVDAGAAVAVDLLAADGLPALSGAVRRLRDDPARRAAMAHAAAQLVDGQGAARVADRLYRLIEEARSLESPDPIVTLRPAAFADASLLFGWRNDLATRVASHTSEPVAWDSHCAWLGRTLADDATRVLIAEHAGEPVGTVRVDAQEQWSLLSWTVSPDRRGQGFGSAMVVGALHQISIPVRAEVKADNFASQRIAMRAGLQQVSEEGGVLVFAREALADSAVPPLPQAAAE